MSELEGLLNEVNNRLKELHCSEKSIYDWNKTITECPENIKEQIIITLAESMYFRFGDNKGDTEKLISQYKNIQLDTIANYDSDIIDKIFTEINDINSNEFPVGEWINIFSSEKFQKILKKDKSLVDTIIRTGFGQAYEGKRYAKPLLDALSSEYFEKAEKIWGEKAENIVGYLWDFQRRYEMSYGEVFDSTIKVFSITEFKDLLEYFERETAMDIAGGFIINSYVEEGHEKFPKIIKYIIQSPIFKKRINSESEKNYYYCQIDPEPLKDPEPLYSRVNDFLEKSIKNNYTENQMDAYLKQFI